MNRSRVVISNHWHRPQITVTVFRDAEAPRGGIRLELSLEDFIKALATELPHPAKVMTRKRQLKHLHSAAAAVIEKAKEASSAAMTAR